MNERPPRFLAFGIARLRMGLDGEGVTTLVCGYGCPLRCRWCINPQSWQAGTPTRSYTPQELWQVLRIDDLYFRATGGGVTFGGGEPLLYADFLPAFRAVCGSNWRINLETSLAVPRNAVDLALTARPDCFFVDIKESDPARYLAYTGQPHVQAWENLAYLLTQLSPERVIVRVPLMVGLNTEADVEQTVRRLRALGVTRFDRFAYRPPAAMEQQASYGGEDAQ